MRRSAQLLASLVALLLAGCGGAIPDGPTPPGLDPVERQALLVWAISDPALSLSEPAAQSAVIEFAPNGLLAAGPAAPWLPADPTLENPLAAQVLDWGASVTSNFGVPLSLGVEVPLMPEGVTEACFDPIDPAGDPSIAAMRDGLIALLEARPEIAYVMPDPTRDTAFWDVSCTCTPCDSVDAAGMANRHRALWSAATQEIAARQRDVWWWHHAPDSVDQGAPEGGEDLPRRSLDLLLDDAIPVQTALRADSLRGAGGVWSPVDPILAESADRLVAGTVDASGGRYGPTDALLLSPLDLYNQIREERSRGLSAWFVQIDGGGRSALDELNQHDLSVIERAFRDPSADPSDVLKLRLMEHYGMEEPDGFQLGRALQETGHALALATHPLGIPVLDLRAGVPATLPLRYGDPGAFDPAWVDRVGRLAQPGLQEIVDVNQWVSEAALTTSVALNALNTASEFLTSGEEAVLRRRLKVLDFAVRAWGLAVAADVAVRALDQDDADPRIAEWLSDDVVSLGFLADEIDDALVLGSIGSWFPASPTNLRALANQVRSIAGEAVALRRDFPVIYRARHSFEDGRINYYWTVDPPGVGWVERGTSWPVYDELSDRGEDLATWWHAWTTGVPADTKVTWRACTETPDDLVVCGSDRVIWTPL